jgi:hypothetical protein
MLQWTTGNVGKQSVKASRRERVGAVVDLQRLVASGHHHQHVVVGWPRGHHGPVRRRPLAEVVYQDRWGEPASEIGAAPDASGRDRPTA